MARFDLRDLERSVTKPCLANRPRGASQVDDRRMVNGIFWRLHILSNASGNAGAHQHADDLCVSF